MVGKPCRLPGFLFRETRRDHQPRGIVVKRTLRKKAKSLQDGLVYNYTYYTYGLLVVFLLSGGMFFSGSFINDWIIFLLRCPNPKKPSWRCVEMDPKHLTPKKELFRDWILFQYFDYYSLKRGMYGNVWECMDIFVIMVDV